MAHGLLLPCLEESLVAFYPKGSSWAKPTVSKTEKGHKERKIKKRIEKV